MAERRLCRQELRPGAVALLAAVGWVALFLGFTICCAEKCVAARSSAVLPQQQQQQQQQTVPRPPPYNPEYLKALVSWIALPVSERM
jgi:hypothetical protein